MRNKGTIEDLIARAADACRTVKASDLTIMMQARDTDPLTFDSVVRVENDNPFGEDPVSLRRIREVTGLLRDRAAAHTAAERVIHMEDLNRNPDFVTAYLKVFADGSAKMHVHCGTGEVTRIFKETLAEASFQAKVA